VRLIIFTSILTACTLVFGGVSWLLWGREKGENAVPKTQKCKLTAEELATIKDQVLLILADYKDVMPKTLASEGTRITMANRIMDNVKLVASR
jgi:hypothetical protein